MIDNDFFGDTSLQMNISPIKDPLYELWRDKQASETFPTAQSIILYIKNRIGSVYTGLYLDIYTKTENSEEVIYIDYFQASDKLPTAQVVKAPLFVKIRISADDGFRWMPGSTVPDRIKAIPVTPLPNVPTFRKRAGKPLNILKSTVEYFISNQAILKTPTSDNDLMTPVVEGRDQEQNKPIKVIKQEGVSLRSLTIDQSKKDRQGFLPWTRSDNEIDDALKSLVPGSKLKINNQEFPIYIVKKTKKVGNDVTLFIMSLTKKALIKKETSGGSYLIVSADLNGIITSVKIKTE